MNITEQRVRQIIKEEHYKANNASRFNGVTAVTDHIHNGIDAPQIKEDNIIPSTSVIGTIVIGEAVPYTINLNSSFTPKSIIVEGIVVGTYSGNAARVIVQGNAQLTPTFYLTDNDTSGDTNVYTQNLQFPFNGVPAQQSSFLWVTRGGTSNFFAGTSSDHVVSVFFGTSPSPSDDIARVTVTQFSKTAIVLDVPILASGWQIILNVTIQ